MRRFLFDRLCTPELKVPEDTFGKNWVLRKLIREELQRLVSGRSFFDGIGRAGSSGRGNGEKTILNFGIDNPVDYHVNAQENTILMDQILEMVKNYEPRLINPQVQLTDTKNANGSKNSLSPKAIAITGQIKIADAREDFSHTLSVASGQ